MYNVNQVLEMKGRGVYSVTPETSILDTIQVLAEKKVGALLVIEGDDLVGIVSERDIVRVIAQSGGCDFGTAVKNFMTKVLFTVTPEDTMENCMVLMTQKHIRHLPVLSNGKLIGIISIGDVVKEVIENREDTIHNLENYIMGTGYGQ